MSLENHKRNSSDQQRLRSAICGHTFLINIHLIEDVLDFACPICGAELELGRTVQVDGVPDSTAGWDGTVCIKRRRIMLGTPLKRIVALEHLAAGMSFTGAALINLEMRTIRPQAGLPGKLVSKFSVWRAYPLGCAVASGSISVPQGSILLLQGIGTHFQSITITGGSVVCMGSQFHGSFTSCTFEACTLYAVHGAAVRLRRCAFHGAMHALVANGPGASMELQECAVHSCMRALSVESGAVVRAHALYMHGSRVAVDISGMGSHCYMHACRVQGSAGEQSDAREEPEDGAPKPASYAFNVNGGSLRIHGCSVSLYTTAFNVEPSGTLQMDSCAADRFVTGAKVNGNARVSLRTVRFVMDGHAQPSCDAPPCIDVCGEADQAHGAVVQLERCQVESEDLGISGFQFKQYHAHVSVFLCKVESGGPCVSMVMDCFSTATFAHCHLAGADHASLVVGGGAQTGCSLRVVDSVMCGVVQAWAAPLALVDTSVRGPRKSSRNDASGIPDALVTAAAGAVATLLRCEVSDTGCGVLCAASSLRAIGTCVRRVAGSSRALDNLADVCPEDLECGWKACSGAAYVCAGGTLSVSGGEIQGCLKGAMCCHVNHLDVEKQPCTVVLRGVRLSGYEVGTFANCEGKLDVRDCEFIGHRRRGEFESALHVADVDIVGDKLKRADGTTVDTEALKYPVAIMVDACTSGRVSGCAFIGNCRDVSCTGEFKFEVHGCMHKNAFTGVAAGGPVDFLVDRCTFEYCSAGVSCMVPDATIAVKSCVFGPGVSTAGILVAEKCVVRAEDCDLRLSSAGLIVAARGLVEATACKFTDVGVGARAAGAGATVKLRKCSFTGGQHGVSALNFGCEKAVMDVADCQIHGCSHSGLHLYGGSGSIMQCKISSCRRGIFVDAVSSAAAHESVVRDCYLGIAVADDEMNPLPSHACPICGVRAADAPAAAYAAALAAGESASAGARCVHEGGHARLRMSKVLIHRATCFAMMIGCLGQVSATEVLCLGCREGMLVFHPLTPKRPNRFERCVVQVGDDHPFGAVGVKVLGPETGFHTVPEEDTLPGVYLICRGRPRIEDVDPGLPCLEAREASAEDSVEGKCDAERAASTCCLM